jgi:hypothetical protein
MGWMGWVGHVVDMGEIRNAYIISVGIPERDHLGNLNVDGRLMLKWIFEKQDGKVRTGYIWLKRGTSGELL